MHARYNLAIRPDYEFQVSCPRSTTVPHKCHSTCTVTCIKSSVPQIQASDASRLTLNLTNNFFEYQSACMRSSSLHQACIHLHSFYECWHECTLWASAASLDSPNQTLVNCKHPSAHRNPKGYTRIERLLQSTDSRMHCGDAQTDKHTLHSLTHPDVYTAPLRGLLIPPPPSPLGTKSILRGLGNN